MLLFSLRLLHLQVVDKELCHANELDFLHQIVHGVLKILHGSALVRNVHNLARQSFEAEPVLSVVALQTETLIFVKTLLLVE